MNNTATLLNVNALVKTFYGRSFWWSKKTASYNAVNNISFNLGRGEILGLLGPNGAGKTTTIQMLLGTMTPTQGSIHYFDKDFSKHRSEILKQVTFASTYVRLPNKLTVYDNLDFYARLYGMSHANRCSTIPRFLKFLDLWHLRDRYAGLLSAGETTRVMLAKAFIPNPKLVLLDEPTASLDPDIVHTIREFILEQQRNHATSLLLTSHNMDEVTHVCNRVLVLKEGTIIADNTPEELAATVHLARVNLLVGNALEQTVTFANIHALKYKIIEHSIEFEINEYAIAELLINLARAGINYTQISIDKPTLEDYFLQLVRTHKKPQGL